MSMGLENEKRLLLRFASAYYAISNVDGSRMKMKLDEILREIKDDTLIDKVPFGIMKYDRWYKRTVRKRLKSVKLELFLVSTKHNLYKFYNKQMRLHRLFKNKKEQILWVRGYYMSLRDRYR